MDLGARTRRLAEWAVLAAWVFFGWVLFALPAHAEKSVRYTQNEVQVLLSQKSGEFFFFMVKTSQFSSANFNVLYLPVAFSDTTFVERLPGVALFVPQNVPTYIVRLTAELEFARQRALDLGMPEPVHATDHLITILVIPREKFKGGALAETADFTLQLGVPAQFIVLPDDLDAVDIRATVAHEVFHVFQDTAENRTKDVLWLLEGTAVWSEDEIHAPTSPRIGYPDWLEVFWREFGTLGTPFSGLSGYAERHFANVATWYGSGVLFKWWTEHLPRGDTLVPEILAPGLTGGNSKRRLIDAIERRAASGDFPHEFLRAAIGTYLLNGAAPYNLNRGQDIGASLSPEEVRSNPFFSGFGRAELNRPVPYDEAIESWAAYYRRLSARVLTLPASPKPLFIQLDPFDETKVRLALVERSSRFAGGGARVTIIEIPEGGRTRVVVPRFADDVGETVSVDLVAVNGAPNGGQRLRWSFAVGAPPVLETVRITAGGETVDEAEWSQVEIPDRVMRHDAYRIAAHSERHTQPAAAADGYQRHP